MRTCWKFPPCPMEPVAASSSMDPLVAKARPIGGGGSAPGLTYLTRKKMLLCK